jgi:hypothetical protein
LRPCWVKQGWRQSQNPTGSRQTVSDSGFRCRPGFTGTFGEIFAVQSRFRRSRMTTGHVAALLAFTKTTGTAEPPTRTLIVCCIEFTSRFHVLEKSEPDYVTPIDLCDIPRGRIAATPARDRLTYRTCFADIAVQRVNASTCQQAHLSHLLCCTTARWFKRLFLLLTHELGSESAMMVTVGCHHSQYHLSRFFVPKR